ncbi:heavy-metal-associated domain-containing protein [Corynebacterium sp.]|uniref:heavy-metal-associated domain-containing protein n=1 Tax=Corynebacterium sp. TaxID=1720 RepID=UPI0026DBD5AD|nr:heavy-metal-associated domain-containing protein [Corynebacterium sp.]MDO5077569.1 heavy-metal-associated domain-containing protein [Corynebacterium sp.]
MAEQHYKVSGMTCEHCAKAVNDEISEIPGVSSVTVDVAAGTVTITGEGVSESAVREAVEEAGYQVVN